MPASGATRNPNIPPPRRAQRWFISPPTDNISSWTSVVFTATPERYYGSNAAILAVNLPNGCTDEIEADRIGIELAAKAGYHPQAAVTLWQKMGEVGGKSPPQFLSTHPLPGNCQQTLSEFGPQMMPCYEAPGERPVYAM